MTSQSSINFQCEEDSEYYFLFCITQTLKGETSEKRNIIDNDIAKKINQSLLNDTISNLFQKAYAPNCTIPPIPSNAPIGYFEGFNNEIVIAQLKSYMKPAQNGWVVGYYHNWQTFETSRNNLQTGIDTSNPGPIALAPTSSPQYSSLFPTYDVSYALKLNKDAIIKTTDEFLNGLKTLQQQCKQEELAVFEVPKPEKMAGLSLHLLNLTATNPTYAKHPMSAIAINSATLTGEKLRPMVDKSRLEGEELCVVDARNSADQITRPQSYLAHLQNNGYVGATWVGASDNILLIAQGRWKWDLIFQWPGYAKAIQNITHVHDQPSQETISIFDASVTGHSLKIAAEKSKDPPKEWFAATNWSQFLNDIG